MNECLRYRPSSIQYVIFVSLLTPLDDYENILYFFVGTHTDQNRAISAEDIKRVITFAISYLLTFFQKAEACNGKVVGMLETSMLNSTDGEYSDSALSYKEFCTLIVQTLIIEFMREKGIEYNLGRELPIVQKEKNCLIQ